MMLVGPVFGAVAVILTGLTTNLLVLGGTRILEGASTAASVPSILGYIALVDGRQRGPPRQGRGPVRGRDARRPRRRPRGRAAALRRARPGGLLPERRSCTACSFLIYRYGVEDRQADERAARREAGTTTSGWTSAATPTLLRTSHVWLLAPTWIAINAAIGLWFSQAIFSSHGRTRRFPDQVPDAAGSRPSRSRSAAVVIGVIFVAGLIYWGNRFKTLRRTTIIVYGVIGGAALVMAVGARRQPRGAACRSSS